MPKMCNIQTQDLLSLIPSITNKYNKNVNVFNEQQISNSSPESG